MTESCDVVIVGAGLAGLRAAQVLEARGFDVIVVESRREVGGRLASKRVDGFVIDEGFQLVNPSYPELRATGVLDLINLRSFDSSLQLASRLRRVKVVDPRTSPLKSLSILRSKEYSFGDLARLSRLFISCGIGPVAKLTNQPDVTTIAGLRRAGLGIDAIENLIRPFLRGTLLDDSLEGSWNFTRLLLRSFYRGRPGTFSEGVVELPRGLAQQLRTSRVRLNERVESVRTNRVETASGSYRARAVVVATDGSIAGELLGASGISWRSQTTWWLAVPKQDDSSALRIDLDRRFLSSALDVSSAAPDRAPVGVSLIAAAANGAFSDAEFDSGVIEDLARLYEVVTSDVQLIEKTVITKALPVLVTPLDLSRSQRRGGVVVAGDYLQTPSIQGALVSGRRAAQLVLSDLDS